MAARKSRSFQYRGKEKTRFTGKYLGPSGDVQYPYRVEVRPRAPFPTQTQTFNVDAEWFRQRSLEVPS